MDDTMPDSVRLYEQVPLEAVLKFVESYLAWYAGRALQHIDARIAAVRADLAANDAQEAQLRPTDAELAAVELLQARGVQDIDLLDRLVERSEYWLTQTVRRLSYFEGAGLAPSNYAQWCAYALDGAYDWIDVSSLNHEDTCIAAGEQHASTDEVRVAEPGTTKAATNTVPGPLPERPTAPAAAGMSMDEAGEDEPVWLVQPEDAEAPNSVPEIEQPTHPMPALSHARDAHQRDEQTTAPETTDEASAEPTTLLSQAREGGGGVVSSEPNLAGSREQRTDEDDWLRRSQAIAARRAAPAPPVALRQAEPPPASGWRNLLRAFMGGGSHH
jgi:hypothetical protein